MENKTVTIEEVVEEINKALAENKEPLLEPQAENIHGSRICECCQQSYRVESTDENKICPQCNEQWERESRWEASEEAWREQENEMLQARGFIIEDDYEEDYEEDPDFCDWLCEVCGDPVYDCGHYVCAHCGTALSHDAIGKYEICPHCEYELEHPQDEIEYDNFDQVHDPDYPF